MSFLENDTFSFWENDAVFGNRYSFGNCPRLLKMGHMAGPSKGMAPITWACPVMVQSGPVTRAQMIPSWRQSPGLVP